MTRGRLATVTIPLDLSRFSPEVRTEIEIVSALLGAGSMMRADPAHAREFLTKLLGQLQAADEALEPRWAFAVKLLVEGMLAALAAGRARP